MPNHTGLLTKPQHAVLAAIDRVEHAYDHNHATDDGAELLDKLLRT